MDVPWLLSELCTVLGYCGAMRHEAEFVGDPPADADEFTDRVLIAEDLDPATTLRADRRVLPQFIQERMERRA